MRLVCPKCVAQYEVDDQAIPGTGREVQCANCEHIWFQDSILMLPEKEDEPQAEQAGTPEAEGDNLFENLEGIGASVFKSTRTGSAPESDGAQPFLSDDEDDDFDDDPPMASPREIPPVDPEILSVLRNEAAFSSTRAKLDAAAALALDQPTTADAMEPDGLASFLADHQNEMTVGEDENESPVEYEAILPEDDPIPASLSDGLDGGAPDEDLTAEVDQETAGPDETEARADADQPKTDSVMEAVASITATLGPENGELEQAGKPVTADLVADSAPDSVADSAASDPASDSVEDISEIDDDIDADAPQRTFRADGAGQDESAEIPDGEAGGDVQIGEDFLAEDPVEDPAEEPVTPFGEPEPPVLDEEFPAEAEADTDGVDSVSAALGALRPRVRGSSARARTIPGAEAFLTQASPNTVEPVPETAQNDEPVQNSPESAHHRDGRSRKGLLPDVEELDSTLRGGPARSEENLVTVGDAEEVKNAGFGRSFIRALFLVALLAAFYVLRPKIIALVPQAALVLDPYADLVDSVRLMIDGVVSKVLGG